MKKVEKPKETPEMQRTSEALRQILSVPKEKAEDIRKSTTKKSGLPGEPGKA